MLADVRGGSESPSMARTVLKWKASQGQDKEVPYWSTLSKLNPKIVESIQNLPASGSDSVDYDSLSKLPASEWPKDSPLLSLCNTFNQIRTELRSMGEAADVPIEPPPQQELCDATSKLPGVVTTLVPGAGGYDAVACLYINRPDVVKSIGDLWSSWTSPIVCPLAVRAGEEGLRLEKE
uniref:GHMP kinase C-terminal domain-containing protein n=1 Tax=Pseudo-nitzschia arenysensis TaxID=697910 RepID=A0A7R9ZUT2_9STRA